MSKLIKIKPNKLLLGDTVGIVSPAGAVTDLTAFDNVEKYLKNKGYKIKIASHAREKDNYLAGNDNDRLSDLHGFFADSEVKAVFCSRGGYGTMRFLDKLDFNLIKANPKIFVGYSDITALHSTIYKNTGLVTFHGPLMLSDFGKENIEDIDKYTEDNFFQILSNDFQKPYVYKNTKNYNCISGGKVQGELVGGNLTVLCSLLGTPYFPDTDKKILFIEDVAEPVYKIDRMLTQLQLAGVLNSISGLLISEFINIDKEQENQKQQVLDLLYDKTKHLDVPVGYGFPASHSKTKATLPLNVRYMFDADNNILQLQEEIFSI